MRPIKRDDAYRAIDGECDYQDRKWGPLSDGRHPVSGWLCVLRGELDEAFEAWSRGESENVLHEIRQVAAVAVRCLEQHGAPIRAALAKLEEKP